MNTQVDQAKALIKAFNAENALVADERVTMRVIIKYIDMRTQDELTKNEIDDHDYVIKKRIMLIETQDDAFECVLASQVAEVLEEILLCYEQAEMTELDYM